MISVELLVKEIGRLTMSEGRIDFYALPVQKEGDFTSLPSGIVCFADAQAISIELFRQATHGRIGRYEWRKTD